MAAAKRRAKGDGRVAAGEAGYLAALGLRVKAERLKRGLARRALAAEARLSERFLAQLEDGSGNISIARLRRVAMALGAPLAELVREGQALPVEILRLEQHLLHLAPADLAEAMRLLTERFGADRSALRSQRIALTGLRGAGKSTLGRRLAATLGWPFIEMADEIASVAGLRLDQIFDLAGQAGYRRYEQRALERILERADAFVLATGGSIVAEPATYDRLLADCLTVWIKARPEQHMERVVAQGDLRPMAGNREAMADLRQILAGREALYARADAVLDTATLSVEAAVAELERLVARLGAAPSAPAGKDSVSAIQLGQ
jgi:XRE family aerobic/anaerobic benzoate catabolism transcriptional regulator